MITSKSYRPAILCIVFFIFSSHLFSCSAEYDPEKILSDYILACEKVIEERKIRTINILISNRYQDTLHRSKRDIVAIAGAYILRNRSINIFSYPLTVSFSDSSPHLSASVLVALSGQSIDDVSMLDSVRADIYLFELRLSKEKDDWRLVSSSWRQAMLNDLLPD